MARSAKKSRWDRGFKTLQKHFDTMKAKQRNVTFTVNVIPFFAALADPRLARGASEFLSLAFRTATNKTDDRVTCYCCLREWSHDRAPFGCLVTDIISMGEGESNGLIAGVCRECMEKGQEEINRALERDWPTMNMTYLHTEAGHA